MNDEPVGAVDLIMAAIIVCALILFSMWAMGFYDDTYNPPPTTLEDR